MVGSVPAGASVAVNGLTGKVKGGKLNWNGLRKSKQAAGGKKGLKKHGFAKGSGAGGGLAAFKKSGKAFAASAKGGKLGKKKGKFGKLAGAGFNKKFGSVKTFGMAQAFQFGKTGGKFATSKTASAAKKNGMKLAIGGLAGAKKGGRADKAFFWASNGKKDQKSAKAAAGSGFSKGGGTVETFKITKYGKKPAALVG